MKLSGISQAQGFGVCMLVWEERGLTNDLFFERGGAGFIGVGQDVACLRSNSAFLLWMVSCQIYLIK